MTVTKKVKSILDKSTTPPMKRNLLSVRDQLLDFHAGYRRKFGVPGSLPNFIVIGAQKCGTTYFYDELVKHPSIAPALTKEVRFFDINSNYHKGLGWYQSFFPQLPNPDEAQDNGPLITGEASPCIFFHPHAPRWISKTVPKAKLILLLRDPVKRAYSHYNHEIRLGYEALSFEEALRAEEKRLSGEKEAMLLNDRYFSYNYMHYGYHAWGKYVDFLPEWLERFSREQLLVIRSEEFFAHRKEVFQQVFQFLNVPYWEPELASPKPSKYPKMKPETLAYLTEYFEPYHQKLYQLLKGVIQPARSLNNTYLNKE